MYLTHTDPSRPASVSRADEAAHDGETIFSLLAAVARRTPRRALAATALVAGGAALALTAGGVATWWLLALCYLAWSFAVWGLVFAPAHPHTAAWRGVELVLVVSDSALAAAIALALLYLAIGPGWIH